MLNKKHHLTTYDVMSVVQNQVLYMSLKSDVTAAKINRHIMYDVFL